MWDQVLKIKMFAEGWVVYPRTSGSLEPTWHEARSAECQVGSGDPLICDSFIHDHNID